MTTTAADTTPVSPPAPVYSRNYKALVLGLLLLAYTFNFIDRSITATIGQAIKVDLKLTDAQLGLLGGFSFAVLYTILGLPLARLAERFNRVTIITGALVVWSGFTALCGAAGSFSQLLLYRVGVGVGEAGCSPPSHSLISDYYEPERRASALSIYSFGIPLGVMIGSISGGWLAQHLSWRLAFIVVGLPGLVVALCVKLFIKEPPRGHSDVQTLAAERPGLAGDVTAHAPRGGGLGYELSEIGAVAKRLMGSWPIANMVFGVTLASFASYGTGQFVPPYFARTFHLDYATIGLVTGLVGGFSSGIGTLLGGFLTDRLGKSRPAWYSLTPAIGLLIATPIYMLAYVQPSWQTAALILLVPGIFHYTYLAPTFGVVQNMVEVRRRATATAFLFFVLNFIALGFGPPFVGWMIDRFATYDFAHGGGGALHHLMAAFSGSRAGVSFNVACPGGVGAKAATAAAKTACASTTAHATREGILVGLLFYAWAGIHYALGSIGLGKALAKAKGL